MEVQDRIRLQLTVHYDGSAFHGWQVQPGLRTVQGELQEALSRLADTPRIVVGAGRTDAGVHATGQVASVDMPPRWDPERLRTALNAILPEELWIEEVRRAAPDFHPRYDALSRTYRYSIGILPAARSPFHRRWCWALGSPLAPELLEQAASEVRGEHSFVAFAKAGQPERGERCHVIEAGWSGWELGVRFEIRADRYLHHMVRYLVGTMVDIARLRRPLEDLPALLNGDGALKTSPPAPPEGLFLTRVEYPESALLKPPPNHRSPIAA